MKILFLISSLKNFGGTERVVINLANELNKYHTIDIANRDTSKFNSAYHVDDDVNVFELTGSLFVFRSKLKKLIMQNNYDLVVVHNMGKLSLLVASLCLPKTIKLWSYEHVARISRPRLVNFLARFLYNKFHKIITITQSDKITYLQLGYNPLVMYNPSPFDIYDKYCVNSKKIISIGRLTYQKGFEQLISAWRLIESDYPDWHIEIYGEGEDKYKLLSLIDSYKLKNINICTPRSKIDNVYKDSSIYVMTSRFEGLPMVLIEAQSFSLPIISFDCPHGPSEIISHNFDGLLVEDKNIVELAKSMEYLIRNQDKRIIFSSNAANSAFRFNKKNIVIKWLELIDNLEK